MVVQGGDQRKRDSEEGMGQGEQGVSKVWGVMFSWVETRVQLTDRMLRHIEHSACQLHLRAHRRNRRGH